MEKKCRVVRLPHTKEGWNIGELITITGGQLDIAQYASPGIDDWKAQVLYITDADAVKQTGDRIIPKPVKGEIPSLFYVPDEENGSRDYAEEKFDKIIASTDPSLGLPGIPQSFIQKYIDANGKIDEVILDTTYYGHLERSGNKSQNTFLKLTTNNKVIVIEPVPERGITINGVGLNEAANKYQPIRHKALEYTDEQIQEAYKAGYKACKEEMATDAVEFGKWLASNLYTVYNPIEVIWIDAVGNYYVTSQLYKLWKSK